MKSRLLIGLLFFLLLTGTKIPVFGLEKEGSTEIKGHGTSDVPFDASTFIMDHIADSHEWHLFTKKDGSSVAIYLPVIVFSKEKGLDIFSSGKLSHGHIHKGYKLEEEGDLKGVIVNVNKEGHVDEENIPLDFSITKAVVGLFFSCIIGLFRSEERRGGK